MIKVEIQKIINADAALGFPPAKQYIRNKRIPVDGVHVATYLRLSERKKGEWDGNKAIEWGGYWYDYDGYGKSNNQLVRGLLERGWKVTPRSLPTKGTPQESSFSEIKALGENHDTNLSMAFCLAPDAYMLETLKGRFLFYFPWESTKIIPTWVPLLEQADAILTCSNWCASVVRAGVSGKPVFNLPIAIDTDFFTPVLRKATCPFKVLFSSGSYERKGVDTVINIFKKALDGRYDTRLHIHTRKERNYANFETILKSWINGDARITYSFDNMSEEELLRQYHDHHVLLHPARAEGFGRSAAEAMATAMPVLATNATGMTEFVNSETAFPINVDNWHPCAHAFYTEGHWAEASIEHGAEQLNQIEKDYPAAIQRAVKGAALVKERFNPVIITDRLEDILLNVNRLAEFELEYAQKYGDDVSWVTEAKKVDNYFED